MKMKGQDVLDKIKSRGYWRVNFHPEKFDAALITPLSACKNIVQQSSVLLRGWDYPHVPTHNDESQNLYNAGDRVESWIDWEQMKEFWRFYQSGQFIHFFGMWDDWDEDVKMFANPQRHLIPALQEFDALEVIYRCTEIALFVRNVLSAEGYSAERVVLEISYHYTNDRRLVLRGPRRMPLGGYKCMMEDIICPSHLLLASDPQERFEEVALDVAAYVFSQFQWDAFPRESFRAEQKKLIDRRL